MPGEQHPAKLPQVRRRILKPTQDRLSLDAREIPRLSWRRSRTCGGRRARVIVEAHHFKRALVSGGNACDLH